MIAIKLRLYENQVIIYQLYYHALYALYSVNTSCNHTLFRLYMLRSYIANHIWYSVSSVVAIWNIANDSLSLHLHQLWRGYSLASLYFDYQCKIALTIGD